MSDEIQIKINGLSDFVGAIERLQSRLDSATRTATVQSGKTLRSLAVGSFNQPPAPFTRTGNLQRSIKSQPVVQQGIGKYSITVAPTAVYSRIIELGGTITPKAAKMLSWIGGDGKRVFAHRVTIHPHPYFTPAYLKMVTKMRDTFALAWQKAIES